MVMNGALDPLGNIAVSRALRESAKPRTGAYEVFLRLGNHLPVRLAEAAAYLRIQKACF